MRTHHLPIALLAAVLALAACAARGGTQTPAALRSHARPAALARVTVENRTSQALSIAFRPAARGGGEVVVGDVAPGAAGELAPIPAGEPIVLLARTQDGAELRLAPRSFELDATWHWVIPADAVFRPGDPSP
ncbi:MAG TPA: hypothetical protein VF192_07780 [Longimicrobiales bacterium]